MQQLNAAQWAWVFFDLGSFGFGTVTTTTYMPMWFKAPPPFSSRA